jgi:hypothetical protein
MTALAAGMTVPIMWLAASPALLWWGDRSIRLTTFVVAGLLFANAGLPTFIVEPLPPVLLLVSDGLLFLFLMSLVYTTDRKFPMVLAASALIGLTARALQLLSRDIGNFEPFLLLNGAGLTMLVALLIATASHANRIRLGRSEAIAQQRGMR